MDVNQEKREDIDENKVPTPSEVGLGPQSERRKANFEDVNLENEDVLKPENSDLWTISGKIAKLRRIFKSKQK